MALQDCVKVSKI